MTRYQNLVNGKWKSAEKEITIYSPINQEELGTVPAMTQAEVDEAMKAARAALPAWRALSAVERAAYLHKTAAILERDKEEIGTILAKEVAKGIKAAIGEVVRTADLIRYAAEEGLRITGQAMEGGGFEAASKINWPLFVASQLVSCWLSLPLIIQLIYLLLKLHLP